VFDGNYALQCEIDTDGEGAQFKYNHVLGGFSGVEQMYVRFYIRFDTSWPRPLHHFYAIHGNLPDNQWSCHGLAGCRPNGEDCLHGTTVDHFLPEAAGEFGEPFFYTYSPDMNCEPGDVCDNYADPVAICDECATKNMPCENGLECCWGNHYVQNQGDPVVMQMDQWHAMETMVKANSVEGGAGVGDGEMSLRIDGQLVAHHQGLYWRDNPDLLLNEFIVWNYWPAAEATHRYWFDNLVVSTEPIGLLGQEPGDTDSDSDSETTTAVGPNPESDGDAGDSGCGCQRVGQQPSPGRRASLWRGIFS
jgi:hypothetical protein